MAQELEPEPDVRVLDDFERARLLVDARFVEDAFVEDAFVDDDFEARDEDALVVGDRFVDDAFVDDPFVREAFDAVDARLIALDRAFTGRVVVVVVRGGAPGRSRFATRRASDSTSERSLPSSSNTPCSSSDCRTRVTARATSSTSSRPRSREPSGSARSTALRTASTVSAGPEPFLVSFFFLPSFLAMARV
jgi:hypothetical protein